MTEIILRVNMANLQVTKEEVPEQYRLLGGRALTTTMLTQEVPPTCHPLGSFNKIIIAPGLLTGTKAPSSGRISIGGKSPLTGTIKEANAGGVTSQKLARLGVKAIVIEGMPSENELYLMEINQKGAKLVPAGKYRGMGAYQFTKELLNAYGQKSGVICIGPAGEMKMASAGITNNDIEGEASRFAARGGLGAVIGSKGLKGIVVDDSGAAGVMVADREKFDNALKIFVKALKEHPVTSQSLRNYGTAGTVDPINEIGALPTNNFSSGRFEGAAKVSGARMAEIVAERGGKGKMGHPCHPGCIIQCSNIYPDKEGNVLCAPVEYETVWALGPNLGIDSLDVIATLNRICNDLGIDTIETGCTLGVLMEAGVISFGDGAGAISLLNEVAAGSAMGRVIGMGAEGAGKAYGISRVPVVKGQGLAAYDPRVIKGMGVTYATGTMGADHTFGYTVSPEVFKVGGDLDPLAVEGKADASRAAQVGTAFIDSAGICLFATFATADNAPAAEAIVNMVNAKYDAQLTASEVEEYGKNVLRQERAFNAAAGFTKAHDRLPEFMYEEPLPPHNTKFNVPDEDLDSVHNF